MLEICTYISNLFLDKTSCLKGRSRNNGLIDKLPNEILTLILSNLKLEDSVRAYQVCRKWQQIVLDTTYISLCTKLFQCIQQIPNQTSPIAQSHSLPIQGYRYYFNLKENIQFIQMLKKEALTEKREDNEVDFTLEVFLKIKKKINSRINYSYKHPLLHEIHLLTNANTSYKWFYQTDPLKVSILFNDKLKPKIRETLQLFECYINKRLSL